jgi:DMSO/TMAO reductase YedYZ molybdopterin-dependent catalytic subunit
MSVFIAGFVAGLVALAFNFLLRLGGLTAFPPESALGAFLRFVPASVEEPMVQQLGDLAGQLGLLIATAIAAFVYGALAVAYDRFVSVRLWRPFTSFEGLLAFALVPWLLFGLVLFPIDGDSIFGAASGFASSSATVTFPIVFLLVQAVFALVLSPRYTPQALGQALGRPDASRRGFIEKSAIALIAAVAGIMSLGGLGSVFSSQIAATGGSKPVDLQDAPAIFNDPRLGTLVDSEVTPGNNFYRVAIDVIDPSVDASGWSLKLNGLVGNPKTYTYEEVQALPQTTLYNTFECVSNQINGGLIGNAKWTGVRLSDLLQDAGGAQSGASYVVFYSVDGYSVGVPLAKALMPDSMVAFLMNDQPLPVRHGYPLRAVIPGLYGMMSAKWIKQISLLDSTYQGYWQTRGWSNVGTVNTAAFITMPQSGSDVGLVNNGASIIIAGYAYAGDRGVSKVEVSVDDGKTWQEAQLKKPISNGTWTLWAYEWQPMSLGEQFVYARVTDGSGQVQTSTVADTFPNGATGYASVVFRVSS